MNYKLKEKREADYSSPVFWSLALLQVGTLAAVLYLCHLIYGLQEVLQEVKPVSNITTEFVIIKACEESFDVAEMKERN